MKHAVQVIGGPYCGQEVQVGDTTRPITFTVTVPTLPPLDAPAGWKPPAEQVSILPTVETLPTGRRAWVLRWPKYGGLTGVL